MQQSDLQVVLMADDLQKVNFGLNLALTAASAEVKVCVFFALGATRCVCADHGDDPEVLARVATLCEMGVDLCACSACAHDQCGTRSVGALVEGVRRAGLTSVVQRAANEYQTITI